MVCAARIVECAPALDAKLYSAARTMDEARHADIYGRFLHEKIGMLYPIDDSLQSLLGDTLRDLPELGDSDLDLLISQDEEIAGKLDAERFAAQERERERVGEVRDAIEAGRGTDG